MYNHFSGLHEISSLYSYVFLLHIPNSLCDFGTVLFGLDCLSLEQE